MFWCIFPLIPSSIVYVDTKKKKSFVYVRLDFKLFFLSDQFSIKIKIQTFDLQAMGRSLNPPTTLVNWIKIIMYPMKNMWKEKKLTRLRRPDPWSGNSFAVGLLQTITTKLFLQILRRQSDLISLLPILDSFSDFLPFNPKPNKESSTQDLNWGLLCKATKT